MVKPREDDLFEQAIFIVRSGAAVTEKELMRQAGAEASGTFRKAGSKQLLSFLAGAAIMGLLWLLVSIL